MKLIPAKCPECKENINISTDKKAVICPNCGEAITVEDAIELFNTSYGITKKDVPITVKSSDFKIEGGVLKKYRGSSIDVIIPDNVVRIKHEAFSNCKGIRSIIIPDSVTYIEHHAFSNCESLQSIKLPNSIKEIEMGAFEFCYSLESVQLPENLTKISRELFSGCRMLKEFTITDTIKEIGKEAFSGCVSIKTITIPPNVQKIGNGAFGFCEQLEQFNLPSSISHITNTALYGDSKWHSNYNEWPPILYGTPLFDKYHDKLRKERLSQNKCPVCGRKLSLFTKKCPMNHTW